MTYPPKLFDCIDYGRNHAIADDGGEADSDWLTAIEEAAVRELLFELDRTGEAERPQRTSVHRQVQWTSAIQEIREMRRALLRIANGFCYCGDSLHMECFSNEARKALGRDTSKAGLGRGIVLS